MNKIRLIILFYLLVTVTFIAYVIVHPSPIRLDHGVYLTKPQPVEQFKLTDNKGNLFTEAHLRNHWSLLFFGFSNCSMICPLTMHMFNQTYERLPKTQRLNVIFISVDPEHDSVPRLNQFVHQFNEHFIALRGSMVDINALQRQLHVTISTAPMLHGPEIVLINPKAQVQAYFSLPITSQALLLDLGRLMKSDS